MASNAVINQNFRPAATSTTAARATAARATSHTPRHPRARRRRRAARRRLRGEVERDDEELVRRGHFDPVEVDERVGKRAAFAATSARRRSLPPTPGRPLGERVPEERGAELATLAVARSVRSRSQPSAERRSTQMQQLQRVVQQVDGCRWLTLAVSIVWTRPCRTAQRAGGVPPHEARRDLPKHERDEAEREEELVRRAAARAVAHRERGRRHGQPQPRAEQPDEILAAKFAHAEEQVRVRVGAHGDGERLERAAQATENAARMGQRRTQIGCERVERGAGRSSRHESGSEYDGAVRRDGAWLANDYAVAQAAACHLRRRAPGRTSHLAFTSTTSRDPT